MGAVTVVWARETIPAAGPSVFLAGPTPAARRGAWRPSSWRAVRSWRLDAVAEIAAAWAGPGMLTVLTPESRGGIRAQRYEDQVESELAMIQAATVRMFWIPRCVRTLPGFTTNVEAGICLADPDRMVLGCPPDCPDPGRNRYLVFHARRLGIPVCTTIAETVATSLGRVATRMAAGVPRLASAKSVSFSGEGREQGGGVGEPSGPGGGDGLPRLPQ